MAQTTQSPAQPPAQPPQYSRWQELGQATSRREQALEEMRQKMHQFVIHELGPLLSTSASPRPTSAVRSTSSCTVPSRWSGRAHGR